MNEHYHFMISSDRFPVLTDGAAKTYLNVFKMH